MSKRTPLNGDPCICGDKATWHKECYRRAQAVAYEPGGWLEAAVAWEVCASIHETWAKGKDALYKTRHADFVKHADDARKKHAAEPAQPEPVALEQRLIEIAKVLPKPKTLGWIPGDMCEPDEAIKGYTKQQVLAILAKHWVAAPPPPAQPEPLTASAEKPNAVFVPGYGYVDVLAVRAIERAHGIGEKP